MKALIDFIPLIAFFATYKLFGIILATGVLMVVTTLTALIVYIKDKKVPATMLFTAILVGVFGGLTIYTENATFIKLKPTLINFLFAGILLIGLWRKKLWLKALMGSALEMPDHVWRRFTINWICLFITMAMVNEVIWRNFDENFWVNFKVFGSSAITFAFILAHIPFLNRHIISSEAGDIKND